MKKAIFLDKDGTLIDDVPYNVDPEKLKYAPFAIQSLQLLANCGFDLFVVSNQPGIALGIFSEQDFLTCTEFLRSSLEANDIRLSAVLYCPHHPQGTLPEYATDCFCRKPKSGLIDIAANSYDIDLSGSWMIGDILNDVEAGKRAGCRTILIDNGNETKWEKGPLREPDYVVSDLWVAACTVVRVEMFMKGSEEYGPH